MIAGIEAEYQSDGGLTKDPKGGGLGGGGGGV